MFEAEWIQAMQKKTSQVLDQLAPADYWFKCKEESIGQQVWYVQEKGEEVWVKKIVWEVDRDNRKYFGPSHAARLLISSFEPQLRIIEKQLLPTERYLYHKKRQGLQLRLPVRDGILLGSMGMSLEIRQATYQVQLHATNLKDWPALASFVEALESWLVEGQ